MAGSLPRVALALALLVLAPAARAAAVEASLASPDPPLVGGVASLRAADEAALDLAPGDVAAAGVRLAWDAARLVTVRDAWVVLGGSGGVSVRDDAEDEARDLGPGALRDLACLRGCSILLHLRGGAAGELGLDGPSLALARLAEDARYTGSFADGRSYSHAYRAPAGWLAVDGRTPRAAGEAVLFLDGAAATAEDADGAWPLEAATTREPLLGPGGVVVGERVRQTFHVLHLHGVRATGDGAARLLAPRATLHVDGWLHARDATGWVEVGGARRDVAREDVALEGRFRVPLAAAAGDAPLGPEGGAWSGPAGDATRVTVDGARLHADPAPAQQAGRALALGALALALLVLLAKAGLLPAYSRFTRDAVLRNPTRAALLAAIQARPGATPSQLARDLGLSWALTEYHLRMLAQHQYVSAAGAARHRAYFATEARPDPVQAALGRLRESGTRLAVARALCAAPSPLTQAEAAARVGVSVRLASYHLGRLVASGLAVRSPGRPTTYAPSQALRDGLAAS